MSPLGHRPWRGRFRFADRADAGRQLADRLADLAPLRPIVLALPRGGIPVAVPVARGLDAPLEVLVVRKLGVPFHEELGMGAVAEDGTVVLDVELVERAGVEFDALGRVRTAELAEVARRIAQYREGRPLPDLHGRTVIIVDDGIATGGTVRAAAGAAMRLGASRVVVATPVVAAATAEELRREVDDVVAVHEPFDLNSVGQWYEDFRQLSDAEVILGLAEARRGARTAEAEKLV